MVGRYDIAGPSADLFDYMLIKELFFFFGGKFTHVYVQKADFSINLRIEY